MSSPSPRSRPAWRLVRTGGIVALAVSSVLVLGACSGSDAPEAGSDAAQAGTSTVGSDLLSSRSRMSGSVPSSTGRDAASPGSRGRSGSSTAVDVSGLGFEWGEADAPLRVLEFSDFGCGYCRRFHTETWPTLSERYVETGKVRWKYVPMVLGIFGPNSEDAALAAECAGEEHFRLVADALFAEQSEWKRAGDPEPTFRRMVRNAGGDMDRWDACMTDGALRARVEAGTDLSRELGVRGTPTFFVIGYGAIPGAIPLEIFEEVLDSAYAEATRGTSP